MIKDFLANWEVYLLAGGAGIAAVDTLAIVVINSLGHIRDAWRSVFRKDTDDDA
jgi:hypothetical protein